MKIKRIEKMNFQMEVKNPFIVGFHHHDIFPEGNGQMGPSYYLRDRVIGEDFSHNQPWRMYYGEKIPGFPVHPHRGFETITIMLEGFADHFDSKGSKGRYGKGDVQWMTAGAGIQHSEMFPLLSDTNNNPMHLFQIWLNLPRKSKFVEPEYKMFWNEKIPVVEEVDKNGNKRYIKIIAGKYEKAKALEAPIASWAKDLNNHVSIWLIDLDAHAEIQIPSVSRTLNRMLYNFEGEQINIEDKILEANHFAELDGNSTITIINGEKKSKLLLLEGEPINEPVAAYGPFVMNTREEITSAFKEYEQTQFGGWAWETPEPVNKKNEPRFASFNNGDSVEYP